jgi:hypothetical protein
MIILPYLQEQGQIWTLQLGVVRTIGRCMTQVLKDLNTVKNVILRGLCKMKNSANVIKFWLYTIIIWSIVLLMSLYCFFDSKLDNLNNMIEVHAQNGYVNGCIKQGGGRYKCMDLSAEYVKEIFTK